MFNRRQVLAGLATTVITTMVSKQVHAAPIKIDETSALLVIDVQNCFLPGGSLAVKDGEQDRGREGFWPPLPPNRTGGFPAYGSPVAGFLIGTVSRVQALL
jgi:hypothetical protein